MAQIYIFIYRL